MQNENIKNILDSLYNKIKEVEIKADQKLETVVETQEKGLIRFKNEVITALNSMVGEIENKLPLLNPLTAEEQVNRASLKLVNAIEQINNKIDSFQDREIVEEIEEPQIIIEDEVSIDEVKINEVEVDTIVEEVANEVNKDDENEAALEEVIEETFEPITEETFEPVIEENTAEDIEVVIEEVNQEDEDVLGIRKLVQEMYKDENQDITNIIKEVRNITELINKNVEDALNLEILKNNPHKAKEVVYMIFDKSVERLKNILK